MDSGFIVFNHRHYPLFSAWLDELGVASQPTSMSFAVRREANGLEYGTSDLRTLLCQPSNALNPRFLAMLYGIRRFYREAPEVAEDDARTLGQFLADGRYPRPFAEDHLLPMCAALWSASAVSVSELSIAQVTVFMHNHQLLQLRGRPQWRVVSGGSSTYVEAFQRRFKGCLRLAEPVLHITRSDATSGAHVATKAGDEEFDAVLLACHSDEALALIDATATERAVLTDLKYRSNRAVVHADPSFMPRRAAAWSSWNVLIGEHGYDLTYWMNRLQNLKSAASFFVSLNPSREPKHIRKERDYAHPVFTPAAQCAKRRWHELADSGGLWFCGAYWGWGFHEDGMRSARRAVAHLRRRHGLGEPVDAPADMSDAPAQPVH